MRILAVQTAFLGDAVLTVPLFRALAAHYPSGRIELLCTPEAAGLLEGLPYVHDFVPDLKRRYGAWGTFPGLASMLRRRRYDAAVAAHRSARTALLLAAARVPLRVGFEGAALSFLYHRLAPDLRHKRGLPAARRYLELLRSLGADPERFDAQPELAVSDESRREVRNLLERCGRRTERPLAVLAHGSEWETKKWTVEGFSALARRLSMERGMDVALAADERESERGSAIARASEVPVMDLTGKTTLSQLKALIADAALVVSGDSAPAHIAAAFRRPQVTLFGPTASGHGFAPVHEAARIAEVEGLYCRPCGMHGARRCPEGHFRCMRELTVERVVGAAEAALKAARAQ
jgi:heptosyltransferase-2